MTVLGSLAVVAAMGTAGPASLAIAQPAASYYGWGLDDNYELGNGSPSDAVAESPTAIALPSGVTASQVSAGANGGLAIGADGLLYAWGDNTFGDVGNGSTNPQPVPEEVSLAGGVNPAVVAESQAGASFAIGTDGNLYAWGNNADGQLGLGPSAGDQDTPQPVILGPGVRAVAVSAGQEHTLAIGSDGHVYAWGDDSTGELGDGGSSQEDSPKRVNLPVGVTALAVSAGYFYSFAVGSDGNLYAWGAEADGALGNGVAGLNASRSTPQAVSLPGGVPVTAVAAGTYDYDSLAIGANGDVYAWGFNEFSQVGNGGTSRQVTPLAVSLGAGVQAKSVATDGDSSFAVGSDGYLYSWGSDEDDILGAGSGAANPVAKPMRTSLLLGSAGTVAVGDDFALGTAVLKAQSIEFTTVPPASAKAGGTYQVAAAGGPSGQPVTFSVSSLSVPGTCSVSGRKVTFTGEGVCVIAANQAGDATYAPAPTVTQAMTVTQRPGFALDSPPRGAAAHQLYSYSFLAAGLSSYALAKGAPSWLSVSGSTGLVHGTPPAKVTSFKYSVIAGNAAGRATAGPFTVKVGGRPAAEANLSVKLSCPAKVSPGATFTCTISVANAGPAPARSAQVALVLPAAAYPAAKLTAGLRRLGNVLLWKPATINAKRNVTTKISLRVAVAAAHLALTALAWSPAPDPAPAANYATAAIQSVQPPG
jgi:alpha-tubulin suppressor-like RCC1 family protein